MREDQAAIRVGAVSYFNTVPLIWGMLHGEQQAFVDLSFSIPSICSAQIESGAIDIGLVPVAEIARQDLEICSTVGIAARGPVRSILLISRVPIREIKTLAVDLSSRTSVQLAKVILREAYGVRPTVTVQHPRLMDMLAHSQAALVIGDPALKIQPETLPYYCLDLGAEWHALTGLPMVFAAWAGKPNTVPSIFCALSEASYLYGQQHLGDIVNSEFHSRGITKALAAEYFSRYIKFRLGPEELRGLDAFLKLAELTPSRSLQS